MQLIQKNRCGAAVNNCKLTAKRVIDEKNSAGTCVTAYVLCGTIFPENIVYFYGIRCEKMCFFPQKSFFPRKTV